MKTGTTFWIMDAHQPAADFRVHGLGLREIMRPCIVNRPHGTGDWLFMYFYQSVVLAVGGEVIRTDPGALMIWRQDEGHYYGQSAKQWTHTWMHLAGPEVDRLMRDAGIDAGYHHAPDVAPLMEAVVRGLHGELSRFAPADAVILKNLFENFLRRLRRNLHSIPEVHGALPDRMVRVKSLIDTRYAEPLKLEDMAHCAHLSVSQFCREFKKSFRFAPGDYLVRHRIERAKYLLGDQFLSVKEIAGRVGYDDPFVFSKMFKKCVGVSPQGYRRSSLR